MISSLPFRPVFACTLVLGLVAGAGVALWQTYGLATLQAYMVAGFMACF